jgi:hypothetical protein
MNAGLIVFTRLNLKRFRKQKAPSDVVPTEIDGKIGYYSFLVPGGIWPMGKTPDAGPRKDTT